MNCRLLLASELNDLEKNLNSCSIFFRDCAGAIPEEKQKLERIAAMAEVLSELCLREELRLRAKAR